MNNAEIDIRITINGQIISAVLYSNATAHDFISLFPLELVLEDYNETEKISHLEREISAENAPIGCTPSVGDITYYEPWGNLAVFYKDFKYSNGLISIGKITSGLELLKSPGKLFAKFELI